jgi:hypothetical protein
MGGGVCGDVGKHNDGFVVGGVYPPGLAAAQVTVWPFCHVEMAAKSPRVCWFGGREWSDPARPFRVRPIERWRASL